MNVEEYINNRSPLLYGKKIRMIDTQKKKYIGHWSAYPTAEIKKIVVTTKYIHIYI